MAGRLVPCMARPITAAFQNSLLIFRRHEMFLVMGTSNATCAYGASARLNAAYVLVREVVDAATPLLIYGIHDMPYLTMTPY